MKSMSGVTDKQAGVVSIFTVMFFIIFISVITVGFVKIIGDEQQQALNNDLSASALAAATSGVEEGKRVLQYCRDNAGSPAISATCASALNQTSCTAISGNASITGALGINTDGTDGVVSGNSDYLQRWTCLKIDTLTDDVDDVAIANGASELIPLTGQSDFDTLTVSWHATSTARDQIPGDYPTAGQTVAKPSQPEWSNGRFPAALRFEFFSYPTSSGVNLATLDSPTNVANPTKTIVLFPAETGTTSFSVFTSDTRAVDPNLRVAPTPFPVACFMPISSTMAPYACTASFTFGSMPSTDPATNMYYVRVSAFYANTHVKLSLAKGGALVKFNNVQPKIDVTGRTNDVFRRVSARVQFNAASYMPNYAVQSGQTVCKNMLVADTVANSTDNNCP
jgi:Tfp pilus assembly protein PilX